MFFPSQIRRGKFALLILMIAAASQSALTQIRDSANDRFKGLEFAFNRADVPNFDKLALYVVFYGKTKTGVDPSTGKPFPTEPRRIFSRVYRLGDLPIGYNWNSESLAPHQIGKLFFDHLIKEYGFSKDRHEVKYLRSQYLDKIESDIVEMFKSMGRSDIVVPDLKFSVKYRDKNYVRPYSFEYTAP